jgi:hypothetical protein
MSRSAPSVEGWLLPGRKPFGLYLYLEEVDALAAEFQDEILGKQVPHALGHVRIAVSDPDQKLVGVGRPPRPRRSS